MHPFLLLSRIFPDDATEDKELIHLADIAMYREKHDAKNRKRTPNQYN